MKKLLLARGMAALWLIAAASSAIAEEYTTTTFDPVLDAYRYSAPPASWYAAKVKPKLSVQAKAKVPVSAEPVNIPESETAASMTESGEAPASAPMLDENIANSPVARSPESTRALPFWQDILPVDGQPQ